MKSIFTSSRLILIVLTLVIAGSACKSSKKAAEKARAEQAKLDQEAALKKQKEQQLAEEEQRKRVAAEEQARKDEIARQEQMKQSTPYSRLGNYFSAVSSASSVASANSSIDEALSMFSSPDAPVLIIISGSGDQKDYDKPTTIKSYLNYLKDQKKNINRIENLELDNAGKISSLELRKN